MLSSNIRTKKQKLSDGPDAAPIMQEIIVHSFLDS